MEIVQKLIQLVEKPRLHLGFQPGGGGCARSIVECAGSLILRDKIPDRFEQHPVVSE